MVSVLDRKLRRDLVGVRSTLGAILLVIVLGILTFVGMASSYVNLEQARRQYYAACRMMDFSIELKKAPLSEVDRVAELLGAGVAEVRPRIVFDAVIDLENALKPISGRVISMPALPRPVINDIVMRRGSYFSGDRLEETIVSDAFAEARGIHPGDTIHIILNNRRQALYVVGTAVSSEFVYLISPGSLIPAPEEYGILYIREDFAEDALNFDGACNQIVGLLTPEARDHPRPVLDRIEGLLDDYGVYSTTPVADQASHRIVTDELSQLRATTAILPGIFLLVATLIMNILMSRLVEQQRTIVGTLKAIGYTNAALTWHYLKFSMLVRLIGGLLGAVAGYIMAEGMAVLYRQYFEFPSFENRIVPGVYLAAVALSIAFAMLGTVRGVHAVVTLSPASAMRARPPAESGAIALERAAWFRAIWHRLGFRWQVVVRNIWRNRLRTAAAVFAATMGSMLLLTSFYFINSFDHMIEFQFEKVLTSDIDLALRDERDEGALLEARRLPAVDRAEGLLSVPCEFRHGHRTRKASITGVLPGAMLTIPRTTAGEAIDIPGAGLVMSRSLARILEVDMGDKLIVEPIKGQREPVTVAVSRIADSYLGLETYADYAWLNRLIGEEAAVSTIQLATMNALAPRVELYRAIKDLPGVRAINDNEQTRANLVRVLIDSLRYSIVILIMLAGGIYLGSILTTSLIALSERQREVATFLVIGYEKRDVGGIFLRESMCLNLLGALIGLPLGYWLSAWIISVHGTDLYRLPVVVDWISPIITVALAVVFTLIAHGLVQMAINRLRWQEALNAKE